MSKALFIHGGALGDFLLSLRVVQMMHDNGCVSVEVLARGAYLPLISMMRSAGRALDIDCGGFHHFFAADSIPVEGQLKMMQGYDLVVSMLPAPQLPAVLNGLGIRFIEIDPIAHSNSTLHITSQWFRTLPHDWCVPDITQPMLVSNETMRDRGLEILNSMINGRGTVILHPGSGGRTKCYPLECFLALADMIASTSKAPVFVLGEVEHETMSQTERDRIRRSHPVLDNLSLSDLASVLSVAEFYVGNDSGVSHLAGALGTPTFAIFGPTDSRVWRPLGPRVVVVTSVRDPAGRLRWPDPKHVIGKLAESPGGC